MAAEKRPLDQLEFSSVILDIEGTTTSINFVHKTLFPYVREHLSDYVESNWSDEVFLKDLQALKEQATKDESDKVEGFVAIPEGDDESVKQAVIKNVLWQMDNDRKTAALKQLQGHIWKKAYESGEVLGHIYDDVHESLKTWIEMGKKVYVYSSGSVEAQKLLFGHTKDGDLLKFFSGHFDTAVGAKTEAASYVKILEKIQKTGEEAKTVLFLTDVPKEAAAAVEAGMLAVLVSREGNAPLSDDNRAAFQVITSFADLVLNEAGKCKRRKISETDVTKVQNDVEMKQVDDKSNEESSISKEGDSTETSMDTSEVVEPAKDEECAAKKTDEAKENDTEEKCKPANEKSEDVADTTTSNDKSDENSKSEEAKEKEEEKATADVESVKISENDKAKPADKELTESETAEKPESASDEKVVAQNGSVEVDKDKDVECVPKDKEEEDKSAKLEAPENNSDVTDDSGIADVNKSVVQSEKSDDAKADDETLAKEADDVAKPDADASGEKSAETANGKAVESVDEVKNGEVDKAADEKKENGSAVADTNGCEATQNGDDAKEQQNGGEGVKEHQSGDDAKNGDSAKQNGDDAKEQQNGDEVKELQNGGEVKEHQNGDEVKEHQNGDGKKEHLNGGEKHDETENSKTDQANANQKSIEEKKLDASVNNTTEVVAV